MGEMGADAVRMNRRFPPKPAWNAEEENPRVRDVRLWRAVTVTQEHAGAWSPVPGPTGKLGTSGSTPCRTPWGPSLSPAVHTRAGPWRRTQEGETKPPYSRLEEEIQRP